MRVYMAVTADKYELPLAVCDTLDELSNIFGLAKSTISTNISKGANGRYRGYKFVRTTIKYSEGEM